MRFAYTPEMQAWLRGYIPGHHEKEIIDAFEVEFGMRLTVPMVSNLKIKLGVKSGTDGGQFRRGSVPANKGKTWDEMGISKEAQARSRATCFKKGQLSGIAAERKRPLLDIRESKDGYLQIKVAPRNAKHPMQNWLSLAEYTWMEAHGQDFPEGHRAVFADHDRHNLDPDNIVAVPTDLYVIITGGCRGHALPYHDRETLELAVTHARLIQRRREIECHERTCKTCGRTFKPRWPSQARCRECIDARKKTTERREDG